MPEIQAPPVCLKATITVPTAWDHAWTNILGYSICRWVKLIFGNRRRGSPQLTVDCRIIRRLNCRFVVSIRVAPQDYPDLPERTRQLITYFSVFAVFQQDYWQLEFPRFTLPVLHLNGQSFDIKGDESKEGV